MEDKKKIKLIENIRDGVKSVLEVSILNKEGDVDKLDLVILEKACVDFLRYEGYKIADKINYDTNVKKLDDLIELFYNIRNIYHPAEYNIGRMSLNRDRAMAKHFVDARMQGGTISKEVAIQECADIIETVFKYEDEFGFDTPVVFSMFGQDKLAWITEFALRLKESKKIIEEEEVALRLIDEYESSDDYLDDELNKSICDLDEVIKKLNEAG